jgi:sulfate adenylyltransferase
MIASGVFSPLEGFMLQEDYESVVETMHLKDGLAWSLPITLPASEEEANGIRVGEEISLTDEAGRVLATMIVEDRYSYDKEREAREVFGTTNEEHPGVAAVYRQKDTLIGGEVTLLVDGQAQTNKCAGQLTEFAELDGLKVANGPAKLFSLFGVFHGFFERSACDANR